MSYQPVIDFLQVTSSSLLPPHVLHKVDVLSRAAMFTQAMRSLGTATQSQLWGAALAGQACSVSAHRAPQPWADTGMELFS